MTDLFSSNNLRRTYRHCLDVPSEEQPKPYLYSEAAPNGQPSIRNDRCARSNNQEARHVAAMVGPTRLPAATLVGLG